MADTSSQRFNSWMLFGIFFILLCGVVYFFVSKSNADREKQMNDSIQNMQRMTGKN